MQIVFLFFLILFVIILNLILISPMLGNAPIISAEPQLRNIRAELTRFVPTAVKIRRNPSSTKSKAPPKVNLPNTNEIKPLQKQNQGPTKDDVYASFMKEMTGFL